MRTVDISGKSKAAVLATLYNHALPGAGMAAFHYGGEGTAEALIAALPDVGVSS